MIKTISAARISLALNTIPFVNKDLKQPCQETSRLSRLYLITHRSEDNDIFLIPLLIQWHFNKETLPLLP